MVPLTLVCNGPLTLVCDDVEPGTVVHADCHVVGTQTNEGRLHVHCHCHLVLLQTPQTHLYMAEYSLSVSV